MTDFSAREDLSNALIYLRAGYLSPQAAALHIASSLLSPDPSIGATYYRERCAAWLTQLLTASSRTQTLESLAAQLATLSEVSREVKAELGPLVGRLANLAETPRAQVCATTQA